MIKDSGKIVKVTFPAYDGRDSWVVNVHREYATGCRRIDTRKFRHTDEGQRAAAKYMLEQRELIDTNDILETQ